MFSDIQFSPVKPVAAEHPVFSDANIPQTVQDFHRVNNVDTFHLDRAFHRGERGENEFKVRTERNQRNTP